MSNVRALLLAVFALVALSGGLPAQDRLFVFPFGSGTNVPVLDAANLTNKGTVVAAPNSVKAVSVPNGSKYYIISNNPSQGLTIINASNLAVTPRPLGAGASAAVVTGDGSKLLITAGTLKVFNTSTDSLIADLSVGSGPTDVQVTNDSKTAYVMSTQSSVISVVDLTANPPAVVNSIAVGSPLSMVMQPSNRYLLVLVPNGIAEISPKSNSIVTTVPLQSVSGGKIRVTPDSARAVVLNQGSPPLNASQVVDLRTGTAGSTALIGGGNLGFDEIGVADNSTAIGLGRDGNVYLIDLTSATATATAQSYGQGSRALDFSPNGKSLYLASSGASGNAVFRVDLPSNTPQTQAVGVAPTGLSAVFPPPTTGAASIAINGGDQQSVVAGQATLIPLSVRVTTTDGSPVFNQAVTFSNPGFSTVTFDAAQTLTNSKGIAQTNVTIPSSSSLRSDGGAALSADGGSADQVFQTITITASAGGAGSVSFTLTVGSGTGLQIISGDGQFAAPQQQLQPFVVRLTDQQGFPAPLGTPVTFFAAGNATAVFPLQFGSTTDADGVAQATFTARTPPPGLLSATVTVVAQASLGNTVYSTTFTFVITFNPPTFVDHFDGDGDNQSGDVGTTLPVRLCTRLTTVVTAIRINWTVVDGPLGALSASVSPTASIADFTGLACTSVTMGSKPGGPILIRASVPGIKNTVTFTLTATGGPPSRIDITQGNNQQGPPGSTLPLALRVQVVRSGGGTFTLPSTVFPLTFTVSPPEAATLSAFFQQPDGEASVLVTLGNRLGPFTVTAASGGVSAVFNLRVVTNVQNIVGLSGNNQHVAVGGTTAAPLVVRAIDSINVGVPGVPVTITATPTTVSFVPTQGAAANPLTVTSDSDGKVTFSVRVGAGTPPGQFTVTAAFNIEGRSGSFAFTVFVDGAKPVFTATSVVNAGSFVPGLVPLGLSTLFGQGLSGITGVELPGGATTYKGVTLKIDGVAVPLYAVANQGGQEQINFQARGDLVPGTTVRIELTNNATVTAVDGVQVLAVQPGIFEYTPAGSSLKYAVAVKLNSTVVGPNNPLSRGEVFIIFFTGGGVTLPLVSTGQLAPTNPLAVTFSKPVVGIGGGGAEVQFSGLTPGFAGLYQLNVRVQDNAPTGSSVALAIVMDGTPSQDSRLAIAP